MKLREATGLGMMTCKKALTEVDGDMEKAIENLRKQGQATATKRADRAAKEGKVSIVSRDPDTLIFEVNSETDFVARNEDFLAFVSDLGDVLLENKPADMAAAMALASPVFDGQTVEAKTLEIVGKIGEKISPRRFHIVTVDPEKEKAFTYIHGNGKIGVVVTLGSDKKEAFDSPAVAELGKDMAMQVAASKPGAISREKVADDVVAKEREIYLSQAQSSGKPEKIWDKIVDGKMNKFFKQVALVEQEFIKDTDISVGKRIEQTEKECDSKLSINSFVRFELGAEE